MLFKCSDMLSIRLHRNYSWKIKQARAQKLLWTAMHGLHPSLTTLMPLHHNYSCQWKIKQVRAYKLLQLHEMKEMQGLQRGSQTGVTVVQYHLPTHLLHHNNSWKVKQARACNLLFVHEMTQKGMQCLFLQTRKKPYQCNQFQHQEQFHLLLTELCLVSMTIKRKKPQLK